MALDARTRPTNARPTAARPEGGDFWIWIFAFGYFAAYAPYSATTKAVSRGWLGGADTLDGVALLPLSVLASVAAMVAFFVVTGWWREALKPVGGLRLPLPTRLTLASGLMTASIVVTTTIAYTFNGVSIVFVMLLMRGGVLILAPLVDAVTGRRTRWYSWVGLALSMAALLVAFAEDTTTNITLWCGVDVGIYLLAYFGRLRLMSRAAKSDDPTANKRYFVEEQIVATPAVLVTLASLALVGPAVGSSAVQEFSSSLRAGFTDVWSHDALPWVLFLGVCSQLTGVFGGLILLDRREHTFCVPVNRSSSVLAGVVASYLLLAFFEDARAPGNGELVGAGLILVGIVVLSVAPLVGRSRARDR